MYIDQYMKIKMCFSSRGINTSGALHHWVGYILYTLVYIWNQYLYIIQIIGFYKSIISSFKIYNIHNYIILLKKARLFSLIDKLPINISASPTYIPVLIHTYAWASFLKLSPHYQHPKNTLTFLSTSERRSYFHQLFFFKKLIRYNWFYFMI